MAAQRLNCMNLQIQLIQNLKYKNCTKKSTKSYFRILIHKNYTVDESNFIQKKKNC